MTSLLEKFHLITNITANDFDSIQNIIHNTHLSYYEIAQDQFILLKNQKGEIIAFGRIFSIWENEKELGTLRVNPQERGNKIGIFIIETLIKEKKGEASLYLACEKELENYYKKAGFKQTNQIPQKLLGTKEWAEENWYSFIVMQY